jgi:hypothetical protein
MIILCVQHEGCWLKCVISVVFYLLPTFGCKIDLLWGHVRIRLADYVAWTTDNVSAYKISFGKTSREITAIENQQSVREY